MCIYAICIIKANVQNTISKGIAFRRIHAYCLQCIHTYTLTVRVFSIVIVHTNIFVYYEYYLLYRERQLDYIIESRRILR